MEHAPELAYIPNARTCILVLAKRDPHSSLVARVARAVPFVVVSSGSLATFVVSPHPLPDPYCLRNRGWGLPELSAFPSLWPFGQLSSGKADKKNHMFTSLKRAMHTTREEYPRPPHRAPPCAKRSAPSFRRSIGIQTGLLLRSVLAFFS